MLKKLILENWKSFRYAELYFDPLTVLIGTNASGKSNLVEALEFLRRMATGETVDVALNGDRSLPSIRGGSHEVVLKADKLSEPNIDFTLKIMVEENGQDYLYTIQTGVFMNKIWKEFIEWNFGDNNFRNKAILSQNNLVHPETKSCLFTGSRTFFSSNGDMINGLELHHIFLRSKPYSEFHEQLKIAKSDEFINKFSDQ